MRNPLYHLIRSFRSHNTLTRVYERQLEYNQWLSREEIEQISWQKLKSLLDHAYTTVPFYRRQFQSLGLSPQDIQTPSDFRQLPLLTKDEVRNNPDAFISEKFSQETMRRAVTSGSSGMPFVVYHDYLSEAAWVATFARSRRWFGWEFGDKVAWIWGRRDEISSSWKQRLTYWIKQERWLDGYRPTPDMFQHYAKILSHWKPDLIAGYTNVIYLFAQYLDQRQITGIRPKVIETTAMTLWPHERDLIQRVFQCPVSDRYGSHETMSVVAAECPAGNRHIFSDLCYLEVLVDGRPAADGEAGELVATPLYSFGMPLIRFRMEDVVVYDEKTCPCGRGLPLLKDIMGRVTSIFTLPSGKYLYGGIFRHLVLKDTLPIKRFQVHQFSRDKIEVTLQPGAGFDAGVIELVRQRVLDILEDEPVELTIKVTDEIPTTTAGKFLVTTSDVPVIFN